MHLLRTAVFGLAATLLFSCGANADPELPPFDGTMTEQIQINQVGYFPADGIRFTVADTTRLAPASAQKKFYLTDLEGKKNLGEGQLSEPIDWTRLAGVTARTGKMENVEEGDYRIYVPEVGYSYPIHVSEEAMREAFLGSVKGLYYQRMSTPLLEEHAGKYHRPMAHPDTEALYHPSSGRTSGSLSSPGGWYDAGDYNKYILNGSFPMGQLVSLYEDVGDPAEDNSLNIPESGNGKSDYLDEMKYEWDWMLSMQDNDGGLFHKLTTKSFEGMDLMPHEATSQRYVVGKSANASLCFAGAAAQSARVFANYDQAYADRLLTAAERAWKWAKANPDAEYVNPEDIHTGQYGDGEVYDEFTYAAAELFVTTGEQEYYNFLQQNPARVAFEVGESWRQYMAMLGVYSLLREQEKVPVEFQEGLKTQLLGLADSIATAIGQNAYHQPLERFKWGSTSDAMNVAMLLIAAYEQEAKPAYRSAVVDCVNYIFGNNPNGVSYLTGFGARYPMFIHHRQSAADGIDDPVPGLLSGGPNSKQQDKRNNTIYKTGAAPMQSWADQEESYASNEICLNWNAPLTYVIGWLDRRF